MTIHEPADVGSGIAGEGKGKQSFAARVVSQSAHSTLFFGLGFVSRLLLAVALGRGLSTHDYGTYSLVATSLGIGVLLLQLGVQHYIVREVGGRDKLEAVSIFKSIVSVEAIVLPSILLIFLAIPFVRDSVAELFGFGNNRLVLVLVAVLMVVDALAQETARYLSGRTDIERFNEVLFLESGLWPLLVFTVYMFGWMELSFVTVLVIWMIGPVVALLYGLRCIGVKELLQAPFDPRLYPVAIRFGYPLLGSMLAALLLGWSDRYFIASFHSAEAVGVYSYHYNIISMIVAVSSPLIASALDPHVIAAYNLGELERSWQLLNASLRFRLMIVIPMALIAAFWVDTIVRLLATADYAKGGMLMAWLAPIPLLMVLATTLDRTLFLSRRTHAIGACYVIAALADLVLNYFIVPMHPYYGAAWATDLALVFLVGMFLYQSRRSWARVGDGVWRVLGSACPAILTAWLFSTGLDGWHPVAALTLGASVVLVVYGLALLAFGGISRRERQVVVALLSRASKRVYAW